MEDEMKRMVLLLVCMLVWQWSPAFAADEGNCTAKGKKLYGRIQVVESFPDLRVQVVSSFPDLNVQEVKSFANKCGQWQFVDSFPDFTIQYVTSFPDIKIMFVNAFPGKPK